MAKAITNIVIFGLVGVFLAGAIMVTADHDLPMSVEGLRCDSCGRECSVVCGSKIFRTCCFNYMKKRGDPTLTGMVTGTETKFGGRTNSEVDFTKDSLPSSAYVLAGPQVYISELIDRQPIFRQVVSSKKLPTFDI